MDFILLEIFMAKRENILPYSPIGDLISDVSGKRVSKDARVTAAQILEDAAEKISPSGGRGVADARAVPPACGTSPPSGEGRGRPDRWSRAAAPPLEPQSPTFRTPHYPHSRSKSISAE